ncbi:glycyl-radical enzyme activating protein [Clostridium tetani]|uniref:Glycyl-radical enzyme activating protein n=1 Tax=Clostridium tetani TaxID=1513 RepID=A0ABC8EA99_CLOTA|nr:glycyl-radical enzyme activating protein [Clostridium tetani]BDR80519.1 glycyl-radical enzyme activating protein [Clostridium tetani]BDR88974.1 glycyl-radical enzyme activating protein [Clostridium tetani]
MVKKQVDYNKKGTIFNIQRFSVNDGPGLRTTVFLKGCPLSCRWCSNPESQDKNKQLMFNIKNCIECGKCEEICKLKAIDFSNPNRIDRHKCTHCGECAEVCYPGALVISGEEMTVEEVVKELKKDAIHFRNSNGGITLSGGEPLMQLEFALELLKACKTMGWHTAMETTAYTNKDIINNVMPYLDLALLDIKTLNSNKHKEYIGGDNEIILENAKEIVKLVKDVIIRVPVIPEFNADKESIADIAMFAKNLEIVKEIHLLPYHKLGVNKYKCIGKEYNMKDEIGIPSDELMLSLKKVVEDFEIHCNIGAH